jgi:hypothetical protein
MLVIRQVDLTAAPPVLWGSLHAGGLTLTGWAALCRERGLIAFAAEQDGRFAGYAVAESTPRLVRILNLEGGLRPCRLLLERLVRLAGERDVGGWFPAGRTDVLEMLERRGFVRLGQDDCHGPCCLYHWARNEDVAGA